MKVKERCTRCLLPGSYPGITFDENGVCNFCNSFKRKEYQGTEAFKERIETFLAGKPWRNREYDCLLSFSGGRDSSYLLYVLTKVMNLKVLAYTSDNGFLPEETRTNIKRITDKLNTRLVLEKHDLLIRCYKHVLSCWMKQPSLPMVETFCTGCRVGMIRGSLKTAIKYKIPVLVNGMTPFESTHYRDNLMKLKPDGGQLSMILGYFSRLMKNPRWAMNPSYCLTQVEEYLYYFNSILVRNSDYLVFHPFLSYIKWDENTVNSTIIDKLQWCPNPVVASRWRSDCDIALLKLFIYKKALGFNDKVDHLSQMVRDGQIKRDEAWKRLKSEEDVPGDVIGNILSKHGIDPKNFEIAIQRLCRDEYKKRTLS